MNSDFKDIEPLDIDNTATVDSNDSIDSPISDIIEGGPETETCEAINEISHIPENAMDYNWNVPEGFELDDARFSEVKTELHKAGLSGKQFQAVMNLYKNEIEGQTQQQQELQLNSRTEAVNKLQSDWGDQFEGRLNRVQAVIKQFGMTETLKQMGLGNSYDAIKMFEQIADMVSEDNVIGQGSRNNIRDRISDVRKQLSSIDETHPDFERLEHTLSSLYSQAYPG